MVLSRLQPERHATPKDALVRWLLGIVAILIIWMPFHAFLATWAGASFGNRALWQAWKEFMLLGGCGLGAILLWRDSRLLRSLLSQRVNQLVIAYTLLHLVWLIPTRLAADISLLGLKYNLEFLVLFALAQIVAWYWRPIKLESRLLKWILIPGAVVAGFALVQTLLLPAGWLSHFGYGVNTISPFQTIPGSSQIRVISTLGGPNQLGSYLLIPLALAAWLALKQRRAWQFGLVGLILVAEYLSHSRSGWIGTAVVLAFVATAALPRILLKRVLWGGLAVILVSGAVVYARLDNSRFLQAVFLHSTQEQVTKNSSNSDHAKALVKGVETAITNPLGKGPGAAGPATFYSSKLLIPENYYLQVAIEIGLMGLALFIALCTQLFRGLRARSGHLFQPLAAALLGLSTIGLVSHVWTDSTTALIWWGAAGLLFGQQKAKNRYRSLAASTV